MRAIMMAVVMITLTGCGPRILSVASHTVRAGADKDTDVIWITVDGKLTRCRGGDRPVCDRVPEQ